MSTPEALPSTILIVEDDPVLRYLFQEVLSELGREIMAVESADEGLIALQTQRISLLITDVRTPGDLDGWGLAWSVYEKSPDIPVIIISGFHLHAQGSRPPNAMYLQKPWSAGSLYHLAETLLSHTA